MIHNPAPLREDSRAWWEGVPQEGPGRLGQDRAVPPGVDGWVCCPPKEGTGLADLGPLKAPALGPGPQLAGRPAVSRPLVLDRLETWPPAGRARLPLFVVRPTARWKGPSLSQGRRRVGAGLPPARHHTSHRPLLSRQGGRASPQCPLPPGDQPPHSMPSAGSQDTQAMALPRRSSWGHRQQGFIDWLSRARRVPPRNWGRQGHDVSRPGWGGQRVRPCGV